MAQLDNKIIAITGAASGIGLAIAKLCAQRGAAGLSLCDISKKALNKAVDEIRAINPNHCAVLGTVVNVSDSAAVDAWIKATIDKFGRLDAAANVAGVESSPQGKIFVPIKEISDEHWKHILGINATGVFYCLRAELRVMGRGGSVMNVASMAGLMGRPGIAAYSTSKHAVVGLSRSAAKEVGPEGVRVNVLAPVSCLLCRLVFAVAGIAGREVKGCLR